MNRALVVYESMFGNTQRIAAAIADGLSSHIGVDLIEVGNAPSQLGDDVVLLVVGGPTHGFGMSRPGTRQSAVKEAKGEPLVSQRHGIREWLSSVTATSTGAAAAFDTRFHKPRWLTGSAARAISKRLNRLGFRGSVPPENFFVSGTTGPLTDGEEQRAREWGEALASAILSSTGVGLH